MSEIVDGPGKYRIGSPSDTLEKVGKLETATKALKEYYENKKQLDLFEQHESFTEAPVKSINGWATEIHELAKEKGWYDLGRSDVETISLIMCEGAEAIEEIRNGKPSYYEVDGKPEGVAVEIGDIVIRCLDMAASRGWNLEEIIQKKHNYNKTRSYRHNGKKL